MVMLGTQIGLKQWIQGKWTTENKMQESGWPGLSLGGNHDYVEKGTGNDSLGILAFCPEVRGIFVLHWN